MLPSLSTKGAEQKVTAYNNNFEKLANLMMNMRILGQPAVQMPVPILTPLTSKEPPAKARIAGWTCEQCLWRVYDPNPDYFSSERNAFQRETKSGRIHVALHLPKRCKECDGKYRRNKRMKVRTRRIWDFSWTQPKTYKRPKLITFALPSKPTSSISAESEVKLLKKKMRQAKEILKDELCVRGGTYIIESTTRMVELNQGFMHFKHHAHCHMVAIAPFIKHDKLPGKCEALMKIGLGRINYEAVKTINEVAVYITKYLTKNKTRSVTWGIMRKTSDKPPAAPAGEA